MPKTLDRHMTDSFARWDSYRVIRRLELRADGPQDCTLTLALAEQMTGGHVAMLLFRGVADLKIGQLADGVLQVDGLVSEDRGPARRDGMRFRIRDRHKEAIQFSCRSFEARDDGAIQLGAAADERRSGARG
jgi:hypothetical protein